MAQPGDELTNTLKFRRQRIAAKYAEQITSLYTDQRQGPIVRW
jgi:hypothetical protein